MAHDQDVVGSNPSTVYWMDVSNLIANKIKVAKWGTPNKIFKKERILFNFHHTVGTIEDFNGGLAQPIDLYQ
jgi:hypothetical protein